MANIYEDMDADGGGVAVADTAAPASVSPDPNNNIYAQLDSPAPEIAPTPSAQAPPPTWDQVKALPNYDSLPQPKQQALFKKWIADSGDYAKANDVQFTPEQSTAMEKKIAQEGSAVGLVPNFDPNSGNFTIGTRELLGMKRAPETPLHPTSILPETTWWGAALRSAAENIVPTTVGLATATGGALAGLFTGPGAVVASPALAIGGGIAGANVAAQAQDEVLKRILPTAVFDEWKTMRTADEQQHTFANFMGGFIPQAVAFKPSPTNVAKAIGEAGSILKNPGSYWKALTSQAPEAVEGFQNLVNVTLGAGVGGAEPIYHAITDKDHDWMKAAVAFGLGATLNNPSDLGKALSFHAAMDQAISRRQEGTAPTDVPAEAVSDALAPLKNIIKKQADAITKAKQDSIDLQKRTDEAATVAPVTAEASKNGGQAQIDASLSQELSRIADESKTTEPSNEQPSQEAKAPGEETTDTTQPKPEPVPETAEPAVNGTVEDGGTVAPEKPVVEEGVKPEPDALTPEEKAADDLSDEIHASKLPLEEKTQLNNRIADAPESHPEVRTEFEALRDAPTVEEPTPKEKAKPTGKRVSGPVTMRGEKEGFVETLASREKSASPETLAKADAISENGRAFFEKHRTRINDQLSGYADIPGASDPASKIIDEANLKLREQALNGKEPAPSVILSSVTRDFIDQAKARREAGFTERSTESPAGSEGELTLGDTLSETKHSPEEVQNAAKDVQESVQKVADTLTPQEREVLSAAMTGETNRKSARRLKMDLGEYEQTFQSVLGKVGKQLSADGFSTKDDMILALRAIKEGHVNYEHNGNTGDNTRLEPGRGEPNGAEQPNAGSEGRATERGKTEAGGGQKPSDEQGKAPETAKGNGNPARSTDERLSLGDQLKAKQRDLFLAKLPEHIQPHLRAMLDQFQKLGVASDRLRIISGGKDQFGNTRIGSFDIADNNFPSDWQVGWDEQGRKFLVFNKDVYDTHNALLREIAPESVLNHELQHVAALEAIRKTWNPKEGSFQKHLASELGKVADEAESLKSVLGRKGKNLLENTKTVYGNEVGRSNAALEILAHITQARGNEAKAITEAFRKPGMLDTIKKYVERLLEVFKGLPQTSEIRRIVANVEALLGTEAQPVDLGPPNPVEDVFPAKAPTPEEIEKLRLTDDLKPPSVTPPGKPTLWEKTKELSNMLLEEMKGNKEWTPLRKAKLQWAARLQQNAQEVTNAVRGLEKILKTPIQQDAVTIWREAGGDKGIIKAQLDATKGTERRKAYEAALNLSPEEINAANLVTDTLKNMRDRGISLGMDIAEVENYATHIWKRDPLSDFIPVTGGKNLNSAFKYSKQRTIPTYFDGEQMDMIPQTKSASKLLGAYMNDMNQALAAREFVANLAEGKASDDKPLAAAKNVSNAMTTVETAGGKGKIHLINPDISDEEFRDYKAIDKPAFHKWSWIGKDLESGTSIFFKSDVVLHPEAYHDLKNIFSDSAFRNYWNTPAKSATDAITKRTAKFLFQDLTSYSKATLLGLFPGFHAVQEATHALGHSVNPFTDIKTPDLNDPLIGDKLEHGLMLGPDRLSVQNWQEGISDVERNLVVIAGSKIPGIGPKIKETAQWMQEWLFNTYIPALKNKTYDSILERNMQRFKDKVDSGDMSEDQVKYLTADQVNVGFGHLNYIDMARNPTIQHVLQFALLAPDFLEARATQAKQSAQGLAQVLKGEKNPAQLEQLRVFAALTVGLFAAARIGNILLNDGDSKVEEPFSIINGTRRYSLRSAPSDVMELMSRQRQFINGRLGPIPRLAQEASSGVNYRGEHVGAWDVLKDFFAGSVPIPLQPLTRNLSKTTSNNPVSPFEQALSGVGFKINRYSPVSRIYPLVKDWIEQNGEKFGISAESGTYPISKYQQLIYALDDSDYDKAWQEWKKLIDKGDPAKVERGFNQSMTHPFTGKKEADDAFYSSLSPDDKKLYDAAIDRRVLIQERFGKMFQLAKKNQ